MARFHLSGRNVFRLLRFSGLVVFPVILFLGIDLSETAGVLRESQVALVLVGVALMMGAILLRAWRWKIVAEASGVHYPRFWDYLVLFYSGLFAGAAMPQLAASFTPVLFVSEDGRSWRRAVVSIIFDRLVELGVILLFAFTAAIYLFPDFPELSLAVIVSLSVLAAGGLVSVPAAPLIRRLLQALSARVAPVGKLLQLLDGEDTQQMLRALRACTLPVAGITTVILVMQTVIIVVLAEALSIDISLPYLIMAWSLVTVAVTLPISIAGLGLREGVLVVMFKAANEPREEALALGILFFLVVMVTRLPGALTWLRGSASEKQAAAQPGVMAPEQAVNAEGG